jgi:hypothetical protein
MQLKEGRTGHTGMMKNWCFGISWQTECTKAKSTERN